MIWAYIKVRTQLLHRPSLAPYPSTPSTPPLRRLACLLIFESMFGLGCGQAVFTPPGYAAKVSPVLSVSFVYASYHDVPPSAPPSPSPSPACLCSCVPCALLSNGVVLLLSHGEVYGHARVRGLFPLLAALFVLVAVLSSHYRTTFPDYYVIAVSLDLRRGLTLGLGC